MNVEIDLPEGYEEAGRISSSIFHEDGGSFIELQIPILKKRWRAEMNGEYWVAGSAGGVCEFFDTRNDINNDHYELGNYRKTKEEARAMADKIKKLLKEEG